MLGGLINTALCSNTNDVGSGLISAALCSKIKTPEPVSDALIIEVAVTANESINFGQYSPYGGSVYGSRLSQNTPMLFQKNMIKIPPISLRPEILYPMYNGVNDTDGGTNQVNQRSAFDWHMVVSKVTTEDGVEVTPETNPEIFTDAPCNVNLHPWETSLINDSWLISKNLYIKGLVQKITVDWGDGTVTEHNPYSDYNLRTLKINGNTYKVYEISRGFKQSVSHTYETAGNYIIKVTGNHPKGITLPYQTTRLISFGDLHYRDWSGLFYQLGSYNKSFSIENEPKDEVCSKIISLYSTFQNCNLDNVDISFIKK